MQILDSMPAVPNGCVLAGVNKYAVFPTYDDRIMPENRTNIKIDLISGYNDHRVVSLTRSSIEKFLDLDSRMPGTKRDEPYRGSLEFYIHGNLELKINYTIRRHLLIYLDSFSGMLAGLVYTLSHLTDKSGFSFETFENEYMHTNMIDYDYDASKGIHCTVSFKGYKPGYRVFVFIESGYYNYPERMEYSNYWVEGLAIYNDSAVYVGPKENENEFRELGLRGCLLDDKFNVSLLTEDEILSYFGGEHNE